MEINAQDKMIINKKNSDTFNDENIEHVANIKSSEMCSEP